MISFTRNLALPEELAARPNRRGRSLTHAIPKFSSFLGFKLEVEASYCRPELGRSTRRLWTFLWEITSKAPGQRSGPQMRIGFMRRMTFNF